MDNLMLRFIKNRKYLIKNGVKLKYVDGDNSSYIFTDNPIIVAAFCGYCKNRNPDKKIYFRGEAKHHKHTIPSLFRDQGLPLNDNHIIKQRVKAYDELKSKVKEQLEKKVSRFRNEDIDNLFQHYGLKSAVVDVVDNVYTAIWFALDGNDDKYGFVRIFDASSNELNVSDLRISHSSLSLRLHTQHGLIMKRNVRSWNKSNIFYDQYEIAKIKFPIRKEIENGLLFSKESMYPSILLDNTFKILKQAKWLPSIIRKLENKYNLNEGDLGNIN
jgi:hypothetical protein